MRPILVYLAAVLLLGAQCTRAQYREFDVDPGLIEIQQRIVSGLTDYDHASQAHNDGFRSTPDERARAAGYLADEFERLGLTPQRHDYRLPNINGLVDLLLAPYQGSNVYAIVEATEPDAPYVIVGAHYDTVPGSPGVIDNASGVAMVFGLAARISKLDRRPFNYIFVGFDQEEDDEVGSRAFARFLQAGEFHVHSVHITDLIGWDEDQDRAVEVQSPGPFLERQYRQSAERLGITLYITQGASSDNKSFLNAGYRTAGVWEEWDHGDSTPHLHKSSDTYQTLDFAYLGSTTELVFQVLTNMHESDDANERSR